MARYKTLLDGEIQMYTDIENDLMEIAEIKGIACDDSEIEMEEREIEAGLTLRRIEGTESHDGRRSDNSEKLHSIRSSREFWQKIEAENKNENTNIARVQKLANRLMKK